MLIKADAVAALQEQGRSLLAVGVTGALGTFVAGEVVNVCGPDGAVVARGKVNFASADIPRLAGLKGHDLGRVFPNRKRLEVIHRDDLAVL